MMTRIASPERAVAKFQWTFRWVWLVFAGLALAWGEGREGALVATAGYAVLQLAFTYWLLRGDSAALRPLGAVADGMLPAAIVAAASGSPPALWALLLSGAASAGSVWGVAAGVAMSLVGLGVVGAWLGMSSGEVTIFSVMGRRGLPVLIGAVAAAWVASKLVETLSREGTTTTGRTELLASGLSDRPPLPVHRGMEITDLLGAVLETGRDSLVAAGISPEGISGVAFSRRAAALALVETTDGLQPEVAGVLSEDEGLLAEALSHGRAVRGSTEGDEALGPPAAEWGWRSALCLPLKEGADEIGVAVWGHSQAGAFGEQHLALMEALGQEGELALRYARLARELGAERDRLNEIQEEARKKLARDLHDGPTQVIAAIAMRTNFARRQLGRDREAAAKELTTVEEMARSTTREIRHMLFTLRPLILESQGLKAALKQYAYKVVQTHGQRVHVEVKDEAVERIRRDQEGPLFYIAEEAVNNARKHAAAENIWVRMRPEGEGVLLEVEDDGVGFNVGAVDAHYEQRGSLGMVTMRERAQLLGGSLEIESHEGEGTTIRAHVPWGAAHGPAHSAESGAA